jgi:tRNA (mo5U34)-methyltransferase
VLATDCYSWGGGGWGTQEGFLLAREVLGSRVEDRRIDVMDLTPELVGTFDVVFFLGVLYHLRHPLLGLERVAALARELLIVESFVHTRAGEDEPLLAFYPGGELDGDHSNWWGPNPACVEAMLRDVGFRGVRTFRDPALEPSRVPWLRRRRWFNRMVPSRRMGTRMVFHARRE